MFQTERFRVRDLSYSIPCVLFAVAFATLLVAGSTTSVRAQEKLTPAQEQSMAKCLVSCNKGDASCQNACTNKNASPAFFSTAGSCVRACADALALSGQDQSRAGDLVHCVRACN
jgi:hypothetical protein